MISEAYKNLNRQFHEECASYGTSGQQYTKKISQIIEQYNINTILDYGSGKCTLSESLPNLNIACYDPCIPGLDLQPDPAEFVVCTDVLEHVEPEFVDSVISDIKRLAKKYIFLFIAIKPACKNLPDGRNAHISLHPIKWWLDKFKECERIELSDMGKGFQVFFKNDPDSL